MPEVSKNFALSTVATAPSPATSGTSLVVATGEGARFPAPPFNATIAPAGVQASPDNAEVVRVTGVASNTLTIVRAQESSTARTVIVGDRIWAGATVKTFTDLEDRIAYKAGGQLHAFGTSRTAGSVGHLPTSGARDNADRWASKLAGMLGMEEVMDASAGATLSWDDNGTFGNGWTSILHWVQRPIPATGSNPNFGYTSPIAVATVADWVNDAARVNTGASGSTRTNARTQAIAMGTMRTLLSFVQSSRMWAPTDTAAGLTYGGTTAAVATTYDTVRTRAWRGAKAGPNGYRTMNNSSTLTIALPDDYPGSAVAPLSVLFAGDTATTAGNIVSSGTGIASKSLDVSTQQTDPDRTNPLTLRFSGSDISASATSVVLTVTGLTGNPARFCGAWIEAGVHKPIVLAFNTCKLNPDGTLFPQITNAQYTTWNGWLATVVAEFDTNVRLVDIDSVMGGPSASSTTDTDLTDYITDTMHQSEFGHAEWALKGYEAITGVPYPTFDTDTNLRRRARSARAIAPDIFGHFTISAAQTVADNNTATLGFDVELEDASGMRGGSLDATNTIRCVSDGLYRVECMLNFNVASTTGSRQGQITLTRPDTSTEVVALATCTAANTNVFFPPSVTIGADVEMRVDDSISVNGSVLGAGAGTHTVIPGRGTTFLKVRRIRGL